jgi:hypothetical protein
MTLDQIKATIATELSDRAWLREIALQLAIANEPKKPGRPKKEKNGL